MVRVASPGSVLPLRYAALLRPGLSAGVPGRLRGVGRGAMLDLAVNRRCGDMHRIG